MTGTAYVIITNLTSHSNTAPFTSTIMSVSPFSAAHRRYVKSLYKRMLENERNWVVRYDLWRARACVVRAEFERNRCVFHFLPLYRCCSNDTCRNVHDPRALAVILQKAEEDLARNRHPDPYIRASFSQSPTSLSLRCLPCSYSCCIPGRYKVVRSSIYTLRRFPDLTSFVVSVLALLLGTRRERNLPVCPHSSVPRTSMFTPTIFSSTQPTLGPIFDHEAHH